MPIDHRSKGKIFRQERVYFSQDSPYDLFPLFSEAVQHEYYLCLKYIKINVIIEFYAMFFLVILKNNL